MRAAGLFGVGMTRAFVARQLRVSRHSSSRWYSVWLEIGRKGLRAAGRAGRRPKLTASDLRRINAILVAGPMAYGLKTKPWTLERIGLMIDRTCRVHYHRGHVWKILIALGWRFQRPVGRTRKKDEKLPRRWLKSRPRIGKMPV
jgi:transposase